MHGSSKKGMGRTEVCSSDKADPSDTRHRSQPKLFLHYCSESVFSEEAAFALHLGKNSLPQA